MRIAFLVGVDATIEARAIVGGAYPAHFIDVSDKTKDECWITAFAGNTVQW